MIDNKKILIAIVCSILLIFLADYYFSISNLFKEDFLDYEESAASSYNGSGPAGNNSEEPVVNDRGDNRNDSHHINSIVAKYSGKVLNVECVGEPPSRKCLIPFFSKEGKRSLTVNNDGTYSLVIPNKNSIRQQFLIIYISSAQIYSRHIPLKNENLGYHLEDVKYPFFILKSSQDHSKALQYQDGNVTVRPLANYDSQKWDLSFEKVEGVIGAHERNLESRLSGDYRSNPDELGSNEYEESDNIKIKLNLDNQVLNNFLMKNMANMVNGNGNGNGNGNDDLTDVDDGKIDLGSCSAETNGNGGGNGGGAFVPHNSIKSICKGCNADQIDPQ
jgi:hypothetical protein